MVAASGSAAYVLVMQPKANGTASAVLEIDSDAGPIMVPLVGTGANGATPSFGSGTYYSCRTGRGADGWPLAAVLLAVARRRRRRR